MFFTTHHRNFDVQLQIHQNKEFAQILHSKAQDERLKSITLIPGHEYKIELTPIGQKSSDNFKLLSKDDRKCQLDDELDKNSTFRIYSKANCMYDCQVSEAYKACQCIPWDFFHFLKNNQAIPECDIFGRTCFQNAINYVSKNDDYCSHCIEDCDMMNFYSRVQSVTDLSTKRNPYINYT